MAPSVDTYPESPSRELNPDHKRPIYELDQPGSVIARTGGRSSAVTSSRRLEDSHSKQSLHHILTPAPAATGEAGPQSLPRSAKSPQQETPTKQPLIWVDGNPENAEDNANTHNDSFTTRSAELYSSNLSTAAKTQRMNNGTIGSLYSGNKMKHLKKEDGIPLWREDIQLEFLRCVFEDETPVFTKASDGAKNCSFAEIYVDAMARSGKTSKVLKEKMLADHNGALSMAMICLLVNVGRMNTTLNFFPEMRAQLRTYHAIPSLQAQQDPNSYKQLQDAPRLKSILKGASEDTSQPNSLEKIRAARVPRTNPVNLIFVLSQFAPKVSEIHFNAPRDFFDLIIRSTLSSKSRAKAFLWLIWWYLESDFSEKAALENPFGPGQRNDQNGGLPLKVPPFEHLTEEQAKAENVDTEEEIEYGRLKQQERRRILEEDETIGPPLKRSRKANGESAVINISDTERTRSPSPSSVRRPRASAERSRHSAITNGSRLDKSPGTSRYPPLQSKADQSHPTRLALKTRSDSASQPSQPAPPGSGHPILGSAASNGYRRSRPETSHQRAVNISRKMRINHILHKQLMATQRAIRQDKRKFGTSFGMLVMTRTQELPDMYDSDDEGSLGPAGLIPNPNETEGFGEEAIRHKKVIDRALRRLFREDPAGGVINVSSKADQKRKRKSADLQQIEMELSRPPRRRRKAGGRRLAPARPARAQTTRNSGNLEPAEEGLDDLDLDLLGENRDEEQYDGYSGAEGSELPDGDVTEDEVMDEA